MQRTMGMERRALQTDEEMALRCNPARQGHAHSRLPDPCFASQLDHLALAFARGLPSRWQTACEGERQMVQLGGEAGIGKSRMCMALASRVAAESHFLVRLQCSPFHTHSALHPIITNLDRLDGLTLDMEPEEKLNRVIAEVQKSGNVAPVTIALF